MNKNNKLDTLIIDIQKMNIKLISKATSCLLFLLMFCVQAWSQETTTVTLVSYGARAADKEGCVVGPDIPVTGASEATWNANNAFTMTQHKNSSTSNVFSRDPQIRIYAGQDVTFSPRAGVTINKIIANADNEEYASASVLGGKLIVNCAKEINGSIVTITPEDGTKDIVLTNNAQSRILTFVVTYTGSPLYNPADQVEASLSFDKDEIIGYLSHKDQFTPPTLIKYPTDISNVSYRSIDENVATVDASTGTVTLVGIGTTTIVASCDETASYTAAEARYDLIVEEVKPTTIEVAIVAQRNSGNWYAATTSLSSNKLMAVQVNVQSDKVIYTGAEDITWIWNQDTGTLSPKSDDTKLLSVSGSSDANLYYGYKEKVWIIDEIYGIMNAVNASTKGRCLFFSSNGFGNYAKRYLNASGYSGAAQLLPIASFATESVTTNQYCWATYAPSHKISIPSVSDVSISYIDKGNLSGCSETLTMTGLPSGTVIERGTGVLVKTESPNMTVTFTESEEPATVIDNALVGVTEATALDGITGAYIFTRKVIDGVGKIGFFPCSGGTLSANKCYLKMAEGQQAARFFAMPDSIASGLWSATEPVSRRRDSATYNICGQRVSGGYRGVVIKDGRKWLVR